MRVALASGNAHKLAELAALLPRWELEPLTMAGAPEEGDEEPPAAPETRDELPPSGDLVAEIEQFLRQQRPDPS